MLKFGVKSAILGSAVYYTIEKGVWQDSETSAALYKELEQGVSPYVGELRKQIPVEFPPMPSNDRVSYLLKYYWNCGVKSTFRFVANLPEYSVDALSKTYDLISSTIVAEEPAIIQENVEK